MKIKELFSILLLCLSTINLLSCSDDETKDKVSTIKMFVSAEIGTHQPFDIPEPVLCMLVKEEKETEYKTLSLQEIRGFEYERGNEYELIVRKTVLANPPMDRSNTIYELIEIISKKGVSLYAVEIKYEVDADQKELIEADLQANLPVPAGGGYIITASESGNSEIMGITLVDSNKKPLMKGTLFMPDNNYTDIPKMPASYKLLLTDNQVVSYRKWKISFNDVENSYDVFFVKWGIQIQLTTRAWLYEDLTEYYQSKYPDAGVRGVVRAQILSYKYKGTFTDN